MVGMHLSTNVTELAATGGQAAAGASRSVQRLLRQFAIKAEPPRCA